MWVRLMSRALSLGAAPGASTPRHLAVHRSAPIVGAHGCMCIRPPVLGSHYDAPRALHGAPSTLLPRRVGGVVGSVRAGLWAEDGPSAVAEVGERGTASTTLGVDVNPAEAPRDVNDPSVIMKEVEDPADISKDAEKPAGSRTDAARPAGSEDLAAAAEDATPLESLHLTARRVRAERRERGGMSRDDGARARSTSASRVGQADPFVALGVPSFLAAGARACGALLPTPAQVAGIPAVLAGADLCLAAPTGSGKTLAYVLPALAVASAAAAAEARAATVLARPERRAHESNRSPRAIVVVPSRELAMQIARAARRVLDPAAGSSSGGAVQAAIGGASYLRQRDALRETRPLLLVGTPGRLAELSRDGVLTSHRTPLLVLDEADALLDSQHADAMARIAGHAGRGVPGGRQTVLVSATLDDRAIRRAAPWLRLGADTPIIKVGEAAGQTRGGEREAANTISGELGARNGTAARGAAARDPRRPAWASPDNDPAARRPAAQEPCTLPASLRHAMVGARPGHRADALRRALRALGAQRSLIFMNGAARLRDAVGKLSSPGLRVAHLSSELRAQERASTRAAFASGRVHALLVTDVAARGLDFPDCDAVFNLDIPESVAEYAHRAGRTARAGREGIVVSIVSGGQQSLVKKYTDALEVELEPLLVSHGKVEIARGGLDLPLPAPKGGEDADADRGDTERRGGAPRGRELRGSGRADGWDRHAGGKDWRRGNGGRSDGEGASSGRSSQGGGPSRRSHSIGMKEQSGSPHAGTRPGRGESADRFSGERSAGAFDSMRRRSERHVSGRSWEPTPRDGSRATYDRQRGRHRAEDRASSDSRGTTRPWLGRDA